MKMRTTFAVPFPPRLFPEHYCVKIRRSIAMLVPGNNDTFETDISFMWFDENGILCSVYKQDAVLSKNALSRSFNLILEKSRGKKVCWLGEVSRVSFPDKETRDYASTDSPRVIKALALLTRSPLSQMVANIYLGLKKPPHPSRLFTNESDAKAWLKQYI